MSWAPRLIVLALFAAMVGLPFVFRPAAATSGDQGARLVVITSHNETIRFEFGRAFSEWHQRRHGSPVYIDWRFMGTSDMRKQLMSQYAALDRQGRRGESAGYDVVFGGGDYEFDAQLKPGIRVTGPDGQPRQMSLLQPIRFDDAFLAAAFPGPIIADKKLYDAEGYWYGVVLSSFGIAYNRDVLRARGLPEPTTWSDLCDERLVGWIALADPAKSGSIRVTYDTILQRYGWQRGWWTLRRACANARYFAEASSKVPVDVAAGEAAAGMCIDFYGRYQAQVVGGNRVGFIAPADATVVNADPVGVLAGVTGDRLLLARRFVEFCLTFEGQSLWGFRVDPAVEGGPRRFALRRPPVRPEIYEHHMSRLVDPVNPYTLATPLPPGTPSYFRSVSTALHAMAMDIHDDLRSAWRTILAEKDPARRAQMESLFDALPFTEAELLDAPKRWRTDPHAEAEDRLKWTKFFRDQYHAITAMRR